MDAVLTLAEFLDKVVVLVDEERFSEDRELMPRNVVDRVDLAVWICHFCSSIRG